jgi:hypothetical protein
MSNLDPGLVPVVETPVEPAPAAADDQGAEFATPLDLDLIERDLRDVEWALARLADGTYFTQVGAPVPGTGAPTAPTTGSEGFES